VCTLFTRVHPSERPSDRSCVELAVVIVNFILKDVIVSTFNASNTKPFTDVVHERQLAIIVDVTVVFVIVIVLTFSVTVFFSLFVLYFLVFAYLGELVGELVQKTVLRD